MWPKLKGIHGFLPIWHATMFMKHIQRSADGWNFARHREREPINGNAHEYISICIFRLNDDSCCQVVGTTIYLPQAITIPSPLPRLFWHSLSGGTLPELCCVPINWERRLIIILQARTSLLCPGEVVWELWRICGDLLDISSTGAGWFN